MLNVAMVNKNYLANRIINRKKITTSFCTENMCLDIYDLLCKILALSMITYHYYNWHVFSKGGFIVVNNCELSMKKKV